MNASPVKLVKKGDRSNLSIAPISRMFSAVMNIRHGPSEIIGLGKSQSYKWFVGNRQAVFALDILFQTRRQQETVNGVSF